MKAIHGGDIYRNHVEIDFSVNVNPLGIPKRVEDALHESIAMCKSYPDIKTEKLKKAVGKMLGVEEEVLLFGNGASELFMAIVHAIRPKRTVIPVPSFYGYEYAAKASEGEVVFSDSYCEITEGTDLLFLANPNNPTGTLLSKKEIKELLDYCRERNVVVVLDECFIEFCESDSSMISEIEQYENLIIVRAFTKIFAIPGVRLGYLINSNQEILDRIRMQLPEWNISSLAQAAGIACAKEMEFVERTIAFVDKERAFLTEGLKKFGFKVIPSSTNFIFFYTEKELYEPLLQRGILIRDCSNFRGLKKGYYRIAVKTREENQTLLKVIGELN